MNEKGEVEKYKARLVTKGYAQKLGIDYSEVFPPVARWDTITAILAIATCKGWDNIKALYGLRQAPRVWYSKIESYFSQENFMKCSHEHTLFVKNNSEGKMLIVSLYVDDACCYV